MKKVKLVIQGIADNVSSATSHFTVVLQEEGGNRKLPIVIGQFEAQAIVIEIENLTPVRPLTHDLFKSMADEFGIVLHEVVIHKLKEGIYYSRLVCMQGDVQKEVDSRTSDAIALALRFNCPIYAYESVVSQAGVESAGPEENDTKEPQEDVEQTTELISSDPKDYASLSEEDLKSALSKAIEEEAYERASMIRDELNKRKK
jgi:bifunctional DNase/RNase